jgi:diguanylate cyclase (GGDEF)-like protein/putative nucleotidyltransferase with HDIG domain
MIRDRSELVQIFVLLGCAVGLVSLNILEALGRRLPSPEITYLTITVVVLGVLYLLSQHGLRRQITKLNSSLRGVQSRENLNLQVAESLARAIDARDHMGQGRAEQVRDLAVEIAQLLGATNEELEVLRTAALLADIGKLAIPDHILFKPGPLTEEERRKVRTHPLVGASILSGASLPTSVVQIVRHHHEWFDGAGYPDSLREEQIPLGARILAVADAYYALIADRPYRQAFSSRQAATILENGAGTQFDPQVVAAGLKVLSRGSENDRIRFAFGTKPSAGKVGGRAIFERQQAAFANIAQAQRELIALFEIVQTMATSLNMQETLELLMSKMRKIMRFATGIIFLADGGQRRLRVAATCGLFEELLRDKTLPWGEGLSGKVLESGIAAPLNAEARQDLDLLLTDPEGIPNPLTTALVVPLSDGPDSLRGTISLYQVDGAPFSEDDLRLLNTVAAQAALAINKAQAFEQTEKTALTDPLTGLPNARHFFLELEQELARSVRESRPLSLLMADIDYFKTINDTFGHPQGDRILREISGIFRQVVREYDIVARYGGDEFFLLLPNTSNKQALETAMRLKEAVNIHEPCLEGNKSLRLGVSIGVATYPGDAAETKALLAAADKAMYADKELNRAKTQLMEMMGRKRLG